MKYKRKETYRDSLNSTSFSSIIYHFQCLTTWRKILIACCYKYLPEKMYVTYNDSKTFFRKHNSRHGQNYTTVLRFMSCITYCTT